jgi:nucleotide-binding universal stress UspA family protein
MFKHLLVPVDLSAKNRSAVDAALELARAHSAETTLFHAIQTIDQLPFRELGSFYRTLEARAQKKMTVHARRFVRAALPVREIVVFGSAVEAVLGYAMDNGVDLIVLSSHRVDRRHARDWGTVSHKVAILSPCPVLLVK